MGYYSTFEIEVTDTFFDVVGAELKIQYTPRGSGNKQGAKIEIGYEGCYLIDGNSFDRDGNTLIGCESYKFYDCNEIFAAITAKFPQVGLVKVLWEGEDGDAGVAYIKRGKIASYDRPRKCPPLTLSDSHRLGEPVNSPSLEIEKVGEYFEGEEGFCEVFIPEHEQKYSSVFWTLYLRGEDGLAMALRDFDTEEEAYAFLANIKIAAEGLP